MGHATNLIVAAMPFIIERKKLVMVLLALGSNAEFKYSRYFQSAAFGPRRAGHAPPGRTVPACRFRSS